MLLLLLLSGFFYINEPLVNMREHPTNNSTVVSQTSLGEKVEIEKQEGDWVTIVTPDKYKGWVPSSVIVETEKPYEGTLKVSRLSAHVYGVKDTEYGPVKTVPYGTRLAFLEAQDGRWIKIALPDGKEGYIQRGDVAAEEKLQHKGDLVAFSQRFMGLPYTWGGRSSFGYDCSGYVQMLYNQIGIDLPRDSYLQIDDPRLKTVSLEELEPGDLIFWGKTHVKMNHVGMYIGGGQFIHTAAVAGNQPWVRICNLSEWNGSLHPNYAYQTYRQLKTN